MNKSIWHRMKDGIERVLPMTFGSFILFIVILYLLFLVSQTVYSNYKSNRDIDAQAAQIVELQAEIDNMQNQIAYYKTDTFKEKEARAKLGYMLPGEKVLTLATDQPQDQEVDTAAADQSIKTPNYRLWWSYFFEK